MNQALFEEIPCGDLKLEAEYLCGVILPQMVKAREMCDEAEGLIEARLYPFPTYESMVYAHHAEGR